MMEKLVANPAQMPLFLLFHGHAGFHAGMHEDIIPDRQLIVESLQKIDMALRHQRRHALCQLQAVARDQFLFGQAVAQHGFAAADAIEKARGFPARIFQRLQKHFLMIAHQEAHIPARLLQLHRALDHLTGTRSAIDEIAEQDQRGLRRRACAIVRRDLLQQMIEQIGPAMDIADRVNALSFRDGRRRCARQASRSFEKLQHYI